MLRRSYPRWACWAVLLLGAIDRLYLLSNFGLRYAGDDDGVLWMAARDYAHGIFHAFHFYGQDYNPMFEALLGAPLLWLGVRPEIALPIVTSLLALAPFWSFALWHQRAGRYASAVLFAAVPLLLPIEYGMMTSMPRGFVQGIALFAFLPWIGAMRSAVWRASLIGLVLSTAYVFNPNTLVFSTAFLALFLLDTPQRARNIACLALGSIPAVLGHLIGRAAAHSYPQRVLHTVYGWRLDFHPESIHEGIGQLHLHFRWLFPVLWPWGQLLFWSLPLLIVVLFIRRDHRLAIALLAAFAVIVLSFSFAKVYDGFDHVIFPFARMFLAAPLLVIWGATEHLRRRSSPVLRCIPVVLVLAIAVLPIKMVRTPAVIAERLQDQGPLPVQEVPLATLRADAEALGTLAQEQHVDAIICLRRYEQLRPQFRAYTYSVWDDELPPTYLLGFERRYWQRERMDTLTYPTLLFTDGDSTHWDELMSADPRIRAMRVPSGPVHVLSGNTVRTDALLLRLFGEQH